MESHHRLIDDIPPEIWSNIFLLLSCKEPDTWLRITCVCRHWRNISLESPSLWSNISSDNPHIAQWIKRSGDVPLHVDLFAIAPKALSPTCTLLKELPRIRSLSMRIEPRLWHKILQLGYFNIEAPVLEEFSLKTFDMSWPTSNLSFPHDIFTQTTPLLRNVCIHNSHLDIQSPIFTGLTRLDIQGFRCNCFPSHHLLRALKRMPLLEYFHFGYAFTDSEFDLVNFGTEDNQAVISLPHLVDIDLNGNFFDWSIDILSHIRFPGGATFSFNSNVQSDYAASFPQVLRAYQQACNNIPIPMDNTSENDLMFNLEVQGDLYLRLRSGHERDERLSILLAGNWDVAELRPWARELLSLPLFTITSFETDVYISSSDWRHLLTAFERLHTLSLTDGGATAFLLYLVRTPHPQSNQEGGEATETEGHSPDGSIENNLLPGNLAKISISTTERILPIAGLEAALQARKLSGQPLANLSIESPRCPLDRDTNHRLKDLVGILSTTRAT